MGNSNTVPEDVIRVFGRDGAPIAQFRATVSRSWAIGEEGRASFVYPRRKTDIVNESVLQFGNWLLVENTHLPSWVGVIDFPRTWGANTVEVSAYTPERLLMQRRGGIEETIDGLAGDLFLKIINLVNKAESTILRAGNLWLGGKDMEETLTPSPLSDSLRRIYERSNEEYAWRPVINENGSLVVYADWVQSLGVYTDVLLHEGAYGGNIEATSGIMVEDGELFNDLFGYGEGATWQTKPVYIAKDADSIKRYGLRQGSVDFTGVVSGSKLREKTQVQLNIKKQPHRTFTVNALNVGNTFQYINLGNRFTLRLENIGFYGSGTGLETTVRIVGMSYAPEVKNRIELVVEEEL